MKKVDEGHSEAPEASPANQLVCPAPLPDGESILMAHGGGGAMSRRLLMRTILPKIANPILGTLHDGAILEVGGMRIAFTTDSYVVTPHFFPGGSIGDLAVNGTVNDLAMCGATPAYLSFGLILEEGMDVQELDRVMEDVRSAATKACVELVTGDTKVVERGKGDGLYVNTSGVGIVAPDVHVDPRSPRPGDVVILSGDIARHGIAIMSVREGLGFETEILSDTASLHEAAAALIKAAPDVRVMRDPTRGGLASALVEIAESCGHGIDIDERAIPVRDDVRAACDLLGFDPMYVANEGKMVAIVPPHRADAALTALRSVQVSAGATVIGTVTAEHSGRVVMRTEIGGRRIVDMLSGEQLPRIC